MYITDGDVPCKPPEHEPNCPCEACENQRSLWFAREDSKKTQLAKRLCNQACPESLECLASTLRFEKRSGDIQPAVFGGLTASERAKLLRATTVTPDAATV